MLYLSILLHSCTMTYGSASENIHMKGTQTWTLEKENNVEQRERESFILRQTHFSVNNDMQ
jgi:hypothetical protein